MGAVGKKLRSVVGGDRYKGIAHWCPACEEVHVFKIAGVGSSWTFDGNYDAPTLHPSMLISSNWDGKSMQRFPNGEVRTLCHYFLQGGKLVYCSDSPHKLSGQSTDLPDWPYASGTYGGIEEY